MKCWSRQLFCLFLIIALGKASSRRQDRHRERPSCDACRGANNTCSAISGIFTRHTLSAGYNLVATIPAGSCNISITQLSPTKNLLALRIPWSNRYVINGNWVRSTPGSYYGAGTTFVYNDNKEFADKSTQLITAAGPLKREVNLMIIHKEQNTGVKYEYWQQDNNSESKVSSSTTERRAARRQAKRGQKRTYQRRAWKQRQARRRKAPKKVSSGEFGWKVTGLSPCNVLCGGGTQTRLWSCLRLAKNEKVKDSLCDGVDKPNVESVPCNAKPCHAKWELQQWSPCSVTCGKGVQTRTVLCKQRLSASLNMVVPQGACAAIASKPLTSKSCSVSCHRWKISTWAQCSSTCGDGLRTRDVTCVDSVGKKVDDTKCPEKSKPIMQEKCSLKPCSKIWIHSSWTHKCSVGCGKGVQERKVHCWSSGRVIDDAKCGEIDRPKTSQNCTTDTDCRAKWFTGPWSRCSSDCGQGTKRRDVLCIRNDFRHRIVRNEECLLRSKHQPATEAPCNHHSCTSQWFFSQWSPCTKSCGGGIQTRMIRCLDDNKNIIENCDEKTKPEATRKCHEIVCPKLPQDASCMDEYNHCDLVIRARLCKYDFYKNKCCESCQNH